MSNQSLTTAAKFAALVVSLPVLWVLVFLGTYFLMGLGALAMGPLNEEMIPSIMKAAMVVAGVAMTWCFYNEMRVGGLQDPITALKNIGKFALASVALPILWVGALLATSFVILVLLIPAVLFGLVGPELNPENLQVLLSISAVVSAVIVAAAVVYQWKHKKKDLVMAVIGSVLLMLTLSS